MTQSLDMDIPMGVGVMEDAGKSLCNLVLVASEQQQKLWETRADGLVLTLASVTLNSRRMY